MFNNKYTAEKVPFSFKFIPYYFFILILIFLIPLCYVNISINIEKTGKIFISNKENNLIFSEYSGIIEEIYVKEDEFIEEGDTIAKLKINQNQVKIDNQINYLEAKYQDNKEEDIKNQIAALKTGYSPSDTLPGIFPSYQMIDLFLLAQEIMHK